LKGSVLYVTKVTGKTGSRKSSFLFNASARQVASIFSYPESFQGKTAIRSLPLAVVLMVSLLICSAGRPAADPSKPTACPAGMAYIDGGFCIDIFEYPNEKDVRPLSGARPEEAVSICESEGKRLCTMDEWINSCSGRAGREFPYGSSFRDRTCSDFSSSKAVAVAPSGSFNECRSDYGVFDLSGNVAEWVSDGGDGEQFVKIGGSHESYSSLQLTCFSGKSPGGETPYSDAGFRCCADSYICNMDSDCADGDRLTIDECENPGPGSACINTPIPCNTNSDCGDGDKFSLDVCIDGGTLSARCDHVFVECFINEDCNDDRELTLDRCEGTPGMPDATCTHTEVACVEDRHCDDSVRETWDQCVNGGTLVAECRHGTIECFADAECDDGDIMTFDMCMSPGVRTAQCSNSPVECAFDEHCNDGDAYTLDKCSAPGMAEAACEHERIECLGDADCDDGDAYTADTCSGPGTAGAACEHERIACLGDADCDDGDRLTIDSCENPATVMAGCTNTTISCITDPDCDDGDRYTLNHCRNGGTIEAECYAENIFCYEDSDCDDRIHLTIDTCSNPGTTASACSNTRIQCISDADCVDDNRYTADSCKRGGTLSAECEHKNIECVSDADCDDGDPSTTGMCKYPETVVSYCVITRRPEEPVAEEPVEAPAEPAEYMEPEPAPAPVRPVQPGQSVLSPEEEGFLMIEQMKAPKLKIPEGIKPAAPETVPAPEEELPAEPEKQQPVESQIEEMEAPDSGAPAHIDATGRGHTPRQPAEIRRREKEIEEKPAPAPRGEALPAPQDTEKQVVTKITERDTRGRGLLSPLTHYRLASVEKGFTNNLDYYDLGNIINSPGSGSKYVVSTTGYGLTTGYKTEKGVFEYTRLEYESDSTIDGAGRSDNHGANVLGASYALGAAKGLDDWRGDVTIGTKWFGNSVGSMTEIYLTREFFIDRWTLLSGVNFLDWSEGPDPGLTLDVRHPVGKRFNMFWQYKSEDFFKKVTNDYIMPSTQVGGLMSCAGCPGDSNTAGLTYSLGKGRGDVYLMLYDIGDLVVPMGGTSIKF